MEEVGYSSISTLSVFFLTSSFYQYCKASHCWVLGSKIAQCIEQVRSGQGPCERWGTLISSLFIYQHIEKLLYKRTMHSWREAMLDI